MYSSKLKISASFFWRDFEKIIQNYPERNLLKNFLMCSTNVFTLLFPVHTISAKNLKNSILTKGIDSAGNFRSNMYSTIFLGALYSKICYFCEKTRKFSFYIWYLTNQKTLQMDWQKASSQINIRSQIKLRF